MRILLALDSDEAGQRAVLDHAEGIADFTVSWGVPRHGGPTAQALAQAQNARDEAQRHWAAMDEAVENNANPTLIAARTEAEITLDIIGSHITDLYSQLRFDKDYLKAQTAEELELLLAPPPPVMFDASRIDFDAIKRRVDLVDFVSRYTDLVQRGATFKGRCPLPTHEEKTASFFVYPENMNWNCFGCNTWGDIFDLAKALDINVRDL